MSTHRASRYGNKQLFVVSDECITPPGATGASILFHPNPPISAPIGLRLLLSLEQAAYSKSIANITPSNNTIAFQSNDDNEIVMCVIGGGLYPNGESVALAINNSIARTDSNLISYVVCQYNTISSHFVFTFSPQSRVDSGACFRIASDSTTCNDLLGITMSQMDTWGTQIESIISSNLTPCTAFLVNTSLSCDSIRSTSSLHSGSGTIARVPTIGLLNSQAFVMESWAPFNSHRCLLHESNITEMRIDLVDSRTGTAIEFSDNRPFELTFLVEFVHLPQAIEKSTVQSQIGLTISPSNVSNLHPDGTVSEIREEDSKSIESGIEGGTAVVENRKTNKRRRRKRGRTSRKA